MVPWFGAVGSFGPLDSYNPDHVITLHDAWPLLSELNKAPASVAELTERTGRTPTVVGEALATLAALNLVRPLADGRWQIGFAWFTAADQERVEGAVRPFAARLAERILERREQIDAALLRLRAARWADLRDLRFATVGSFGLDWGGLIALKRSGHLVHNKEQAGGRRYVAYALDPVEQYQTKDYTGSHSAWLTGGYTFTSFGDHSGGRFGLPDLAWHLAYTAGKPERVPAERLTGYRNLLLESLDGPLVAAARVLAGEGEGEGEGADALLGQKWLEAAGGLKDGKPAVPVFWWAEEGPAIREVVRLVQTVTVEVVAAAYDPLKAALAGISPLRHDVPFGECFNAIWHTWFGQTNRALAEAAYLADPEPSFAGEGRYRWWLSVGESQMSFNDEE